MENKVINKTELEARMQKETFVRSAKVNVSNIDIDARTAELSFASEFPVERWFGNEILEMSSRAADLNRLNNGGALLSDHDTGRQIGKVEKAWIGDDKRGHAIVKFSTRRAGQEEFQDVIEGIRTNVSFGYRVIDFLTEKGEGKAPDTITVTRWEAFEISLVAVPADASVGVGRSKEEVIPDTLLGAVDQVAIEDVREAIVEVKTENKRGSTKMENETIPATAQFSREQEMIEFGKMFGKDELARQFALDPNKSIEQLRAAISDGYRAEAGISATQEAAPTDLNLTEKEVRNYSISRAILAQADGNWRGAEFEQECNQEISKRLGRESSGFFVPSDIQNVRDLSATGGLTSGGALISTDHMPQSFIDLLRSKVRMLQAGVQVMSGLVGNPSIPRQDAAATGYWVAEGVPPTESQLVLGQLALSPKTCGAMTEFTRQLLVQSAPSIDMLVKSDIAAVLARTIDSAIIAGSGAAGQPTGIINTTGVSEVVLSGAGLTFDWSDAVEFESLIAEGNAPEATKWITRPGIRGTLKTRPKIGSTYPIYLVGDDNKLNGYDVDVTTQMPANTMIFGDFSTVILGEWGILEIEANKYGTSFGHGGIQVRGLHMVDVAVRYPQALKKTVAFL